MQILKVKDNYNIDTAEFYSSYLALFQAEPTV